jgi:hypothetical protein
VFREVAAAAKVVLVLLPRSATALNKGGAHSARADRKIGSQMKKRLALYCVS